MADGVRNGAMTGESKVTADESFHSVPQIWNDELDLPEMLPKRFSYEGLQIMNGYSCIVNNDIAPMIVCIAEAHIKMETNVSMEDDDKSLLLNYDDKLASEAVDSLELRPRDPEAPASSAESLLDAVVMMDRILEKILADLEKEEWYHGCLPIEDIAGLLIRDGDFLLRGLGPEGDRSAMACLSVKWNGKMQDFPIHHVVIGNDSAFTINGDVKSNNIMALIKYHQSSKIPVNENVRLINAIPKQPWELTSDKVKLVRKLGAGAFGEVWQGEMREGPNAPAVEVAVKMKKVRAENKAKLDEMYREARLMRQYKHKNVVAFYGVVLNAGDTAMIVMELIDGGSLKDYLKSHHENIPVKTRLSYGIDAAVGLVYLHTKGCMHRDVACRNCLIDVKKGVVKISDFGSSKQAESYTIPPTEKFAVKWQAPEVLQKLVYTAKSDVYSYGILLWEIFNNAEQPFKGFDNKTVRAKISDPKFRPQIDINHPIVVHRVLRTCWRADPNKRPQMAQVARFLIHAPEKLLLPRSTLVATASPIIASPAGASNASNTRTGRKKVPTMRSNSHERAQRSREHVTQNLRSTRRFGSLDRIWKSKMKSSSK